MNKKIVLIAISLTAAATVAALAHGGATGIVKQRMDGMMAMGKAVKVVGNMLRGKATFDPQQVANSADIIRQHAADMDKLFPDTKASREGKGTEALPDIWQKMDAFLALADDLDARAVNLKTVAQTGDKNQVRMEFGKLAKACSACHADFRKTKK